jgi:small subunit ribosomal protein S6
MRLYEVVYILDPALQPEAVTAKLEKFHALAVASGGEVQAVDHWGVRQLAYPIKKLQSGYYVVAQFTANGVSLPEFERLLKLDGEVLRYLLVLNEGEPTNGQSLVAEVPAHLQGEREGSDDDDDEPEDDDDPTASPPSSSARGGVVAAWTGRASRCSTSRTCRRSLVSSPSRGRSCRSARRR